MEVCFREYLAVNHSAMRGKQGRRRTKKAKKIPRSQVELSRGIRERNRKFNFLNLTVKQARNLNVNFWPQPTATCVCASVQGGEKGARKCINLRYVRRYGFTMTLWAQVQKPKKPEPTRRKLLRLGVVERLSVPTRRANALESAKSIAIEAFASPLKEGRFFIIL